MRKRLSYIAYPENRHTAHDDTYPFTMLEHIKECGIPDMFYCWGMYGQTLPDAIDLYFDIRPKLEWWGRSQELDEAFSKALPAEYKDMPYDPRFGFYTTVPDSEDIIQIMAPTIMVDENIIRPTELPKFCQPICWLYGGFPADLNIPPYATWWSERVLDQNPQMKYVKVEEI